MKRSPAKLAGPLWVLAAALLWSTNGLFVKSHLFDDWPPETRGFLLAFWRALFAGAWLLPAVRRPAWRWALVPMSLAFTLMSASFLESMTLTTAANAIWLQNTAPVWVLLLGLTVWREPLDPRDLVPLVAGVAGVATILAFELGAHAVGGLSLWGVGFGLLSGVGYAVVVAAMRRLRDLDTGWLVAVNLFVSAALLAPVALIRGPWPTTNQWFALAAFGLFQMGLPYLCFARGLRTVSAQAGAGIALVEPVASPVWVWLVWNERPAAWTLAGAGMILVGLLVRYTCFAATPTQTTAGDEPVLSGAPRADAEPRPAR